MVAAPALRDLAHFAEGMGRRAQVLHGRTASGIEIWRGEACELDLVVVPDWSPDGSRMRVMMRTPDERSEQPRRADEPFPFWSILPLDCSKERLLDLLFTVYSLAMQQCQMHR